MFLFHIFLLLSIYIHIFLYIFEHLSHQCFKILVWWWYYFCHFWAYCYCMIFLLFVGQFSRLLYILNNFILDGVYCHVLYCGGTGFYYPHLKSINFFRACIKISCEAIWSFKASLKPFKVRSNLVLLLRCVSTGFTTECHKSSVRSSYSSYSEIKCLPTRYKFWKLFSV